LKGADKVTVTLWPKKRGDVPENDVLTKKKLDTGNRQSQENNRREKKVSPPRARCRVKS